MSIIGIDIDGILADFNSGYVKKIIEVTGKDNFGPDFNHSMITRWEYPQELFGYSNEEIKEVWRGISNDANFWFDLDPYSEALNFIDGINDIDKWLDIYFITSRPGKTAKHQTEMWLRKNLSIDGTVLISSEKGLCARALKLDYYIDDRTENCLDVNMNSKTKCYMLKQPWNVEINGVPRIDSIMEFVEVIKNAS